MYHSKTVRKNVGVQANERAETAHSLPTLPLLGLISAAIGTVLALIFVPSDPEAKGALFLPGLLMSLGLAVTPFLCALREPRSILRGEHLLVLAPIYWLLLDLIVGSYEMENVQSEDIQLAFVTIGLFVAAVWMSALQGPWRLPRVLERASAFDLPTSTFFWIALLVFGLGIFKFAYPCHFNPQLMIYFLGADRWSAPWNRGEQGGWSAFIDHMQYFGYLLPAFAVVMARKTRWLDPRTLIIIVLALIIAIFMAQEGGRRNIGVVFGIGLILWMLGQRRFGTKGLAVIGLCAAIILGVMQFMIKVRNVGLGAVLQDQSILEDQGKALIVDDNFLRLSQTIYLMPDLHPYTGLQYLVWVLVRPIPRVFWEGKPLDGGFNLTETLGFEGVSLCTSVIGEFYMIYGFLAVAIGGWVYGRLASMANPLINANRSFSAHLLYAIWMMALFAGMRSMIDLMLISYVILAWIGLCGFSAFVTGKRH